MKEIRTSEKEEIRKKQEKIGELFSSADFEKYGQFLEEISEVPAILIFILRGKRPLCVFSAGIESFPLQVSNLIYSHFLHKQTPFIVENIQQNSQFAKKLPIKISSLCAVPIKNNSTDNLGFIVFLDFTPRKFSNTELLRFNLIANWLAIQIENCNLKALIEETNQENRHLREKLHQCQVTLRETESIACLGHWDWDIQNNLLEWSEEVYHIFGLDKNGEEINYQTFLERVHPEDKQRVLEAAREALQNKKPYSITHRILLQDGTVRVIHDQAVVFRNQEDVPVRMMGTIQDITEFVQLKDALSRSHKKMVTIFDSLIDGLTITDLEGKIMDANPALVKMYGYDNIEEITGKSALEMIAPYDREKAMENLRRTLESGFVRGVEYDCLRKDGSIFPVEVSASLLENENGEPIGFVGITKDITERKEIEDKLKIYTAQLKALLNNLYISIILIDKNYGILEFNEKAIEETLLMTGKKLRKGVSFLNYIEDPKKFKYHFDLALAGIPTHFGTNFKSKDGKEFWYEVSYLPIELNNQFLGVSKITLNVSQKGRALQELENSRAKFQELALHLQNILEKERIKLAQYIHDEIGHLLSLLQIDFDLLAQKYRESNPRLSQQLNLMGVKVEQTLQGLRKQARELSPNILKHLGLLAAMEWFCKQFETKTDLNINFKMPTTPIKLSHNKELTLFRVLQEGLFNVQKHAQASRVSVSLKVRDGKQVILSIKDNGVGVKDIKNALQDSFGLFSMQLRLQSLGGELKFKGEAGKGTTLKAIIPIS